MAIENVLNDLFVDKSDMGEFIEEYKRNVIGNQTKLMIQLDKYYFFQDHIAKSIYGLIISYDNIIILLTIFLLANMLIRVGHKYVMRHNQFLELYNSRINPTQYEELIELRLLTNNNV